MAVSPMLARFHVFEILAEAVATKKWRVGLWVIGLSRSGRISGLGRAECKTRAARAAAEQLKIAADGSVQKEKTCSVESQHSCMVSLVIWRFWQLSYMPLDLSEILASRSPLTPDRSCTSPMHWQLTSDCWVYSRSSTA